MDVVTVKAVMTKAEDVCVPLGVESVVSVAVFLTGLCPENEYSGVEKGAEEGSSYR